MKVKITIESKNLVKGDISFICNSIQEFLDNNGIHDYKLSDEVENVSEKD